MTRARKNDPPNEPAPLRRLALTVEEPRAARFAWVLGELDEAGQWQEVKRAARPAATYQAALADGHAALQGLAEDPDLGPRADPVANPGTKGKPEQETAPRKKAFFGFGPVR